MLDPSGPIEWICVSLEAGPRSLKTVFSRHLLWFKVLHWKMLALDLEGGREGTITALVLARGPESLADSRAKVLPVTPKGSPANHP